jgi:hypothetical protein
MRWMLLLPLSLTCGLLSGCDSRHPVDKDTLFRSVIEAVPDYQDFLTVDELHQSILDLGDEYPNLVSVTVVGRSTEGAPIYEFRIGQGRHHALLFGFPHPNEPIGSMMLHFLTRELATNERLRNHFDFTWHIVICAEPDKARLNEGWFKGDLTLTKYARHFYRPPSHQQVEWTFPVGYGSYRFDQPIPETRALMKIIDANPIHFSFGLHNSGFGGVYYYWSHDVPELYPTLYDLIEEQGLPLHLGEPEVPWGVKFDHRSMFRMVYFTELYDYMKKHSPTPPDEILNSGASSDDYIGERYGALTVNCELPYFFDPRIEDTAPSDMTRRQAQLEAIARARRQYAWTKERYQTVRPLLTTSSLFVDAVEEMLRTAENGLDTLENAVRSEEEFERQATRAEKWDALSLRKFFGLLQLGQFVRLLEHEERHCETACPQVLESVLDESRAEFEQRAAEAEMELDYEVVPIRKLASIQLATALLAMDHVQTSPDFRVPH